MALNENVLEVIILTCAECVMRWIEKFNRHNLSST